MKVCGQEMKVTIPVHGRERTFSEQELIDILEKHFSNEATEQVSTAKVAKVPTEDQWFKVNPLGIDQKLFKKQRTDKSQEMTRQLILEAFAKVKSNPKKYGRKFKTMMPKKTWNYKKVSELKDLARKLGDHMANWVEQALEWAQRIANGESWEAICNRDDTANWYRLVAWKNGHTRLVGGSVDDLNTNPASYVGSNYCCVYDGLGYAVPLVVLYEK